MMTASIYWTLAERSQAPLETCETFLSEAEQQKLSALRFPKRRTEWLLGRWAAKFLAHSLPAYQSYFLDEIEICNSPEGVPRIRLPEEAPSRACLTISHSGDLAFCALAAGDGLAIGADLEKVEPRPASFVEDYFTLQELEQVKACPAELRDLAATLVWSVKESMLKALQVGLRWDTRQVEVSGVDQAVISS